jgi:hypothetical protein
MSTSNRFLCSLVDRQFYETLSRYPVDETHFVNLARRLVPASWELRRNEVWMHCGFSLACDNIGRLFSGIHRESTNECKMTGSAN